VLRRTFIVFSMPIEITEEGETIMNQQRSIIILAFAAAIVADGGRARADFIFGEPTNLGDPVNSSYDECGPYVSADGLSLYFTGFVNNRPEGYGGMDIWLSTRDSKDDNWSTPQNLGPPINSLADEHAFCISADGLVLYFGSNQSGGSGGYDLWVATRATTGDPWGEPSNLGSTVNSEYTDICPSLSADGLSLYFSGGPYIPRPEGLGQGDIWVTTRATVSDPWGPPENLGAAVNSPYREMSPSISSDGRVLFYQSNRSGTAADIWMTTRATTDDDWEPAVRLELPISSPEPDPTPFISADGSTLYFCSKRSGGHGSYDLYQAPIFPVVDFNGDGAVDGEDIDIMVDCWGTDERLCDIGPMPWGDGVVDVQDLIVLVEYMVDARAGVSDRSGVE
jgi:hypothetical protein